MISMNASHRSIQFGDGVMEGLLVCSCGLLHIHCPNLQVVHAWCYMTLLQQLGKFTEIQGHFCVCMVFLSFLFLFLSHCDTVPNCKGFFQWKKTVTQSLWIKRSSQKMRQPLMFVLFWVFTIWKIHSGILWHATHPFLWMFCVLTGGTLRCTITIWQITHTTFHLARQSAVLWRKFYSRTNVYISADIHLITEIQELPIGFGLKDSWGTLGKSVNLQFISNCGERPQISFWPWTSSPEESMK